MTLETFAALLDGVGIPVAFRAFEQENAKPLPFICWLYLNDEAFAADGVAYFSTRRVHVELYTEYVDFALEQKLEDVLKKAGLFFTKSMEYIESEGCYQILYELNI